MTRTEEHTSPTSSSRRARAALRCATIVVTGAAFAGCANAEQRALDGVKAAVTTELAALASAAQALQAAAPTPDADGWSSAADGALVLEMKQRWRDARRSYERVEGAIAVLFPDLDASTDERYDGFLAEGADDDLFDGAGVTGVHAIERILFADEIPAKVTAFEAALPGYVAAAFPATEAQATAFRDGLCQRLVDDTAAMRDGFAPLALDTASAYRGVIGSIEEQIEKVMLAETGEDESRYAQFTLADMRANLEGGLAIFEAFDPMFDERGATSEHDLVHEGFERIAAHYETLPGDAIPAVPPTWNPDTPSEADLATPYGQLFTLLTAETDPSSSSSLVAAMIAGADALGIPQLP
jgi:iron uptake system component EfeO